MSTFGTKVIGCLLLLAALVVAQSGLQDDPKYRMYYVWWSIALAVCGITCLVDRKRENLL